MEYECGMGESDDPYIDSSIRDRYRLINVTVAAVNKSSDVNIPNVLLPLSSLDNDSGHKWRIFAATYSFSDLGLAVPGEGSIRDKPLNICQGGSRINCFSVNATNDEQLDFLSQPSVLSLSLNNRSTIFPNNTAVIITFPHDKDVNSFQIRIFVKINFFAARTRCGPPLRVLELQPPGLEW